MRNISHPLTQPTKLYRKIIYSAVTSGTGAANPNHTLIIRNLNNSCYRIAYRYIGSATFIPLRQLCGKQSELGYPTALIKNRNRFNLKSPLVEILGERYGAKVMRNDRVLRYTNLFIHLLGTDEDTNILIIQLFKSTMSYT